MKVLIFGQLAEIIGTDVLEFENVPNTQNLIELLNSLHPELANKKYAIAVDKNIISENTKLTENNTVALLPPFSGG